MRFADWLSERDVSDAEFARRIGVTRETVRRYRTGARTPDKETMGRISAETLGAVTANDFFATPINEGVVG